MQDRFSSRLHDWLQLKSGRKISELELMMKELSMTSRNYEGEMLLARRDTGKFQPARSATLTYG